VGLGGISIWQLLIILVIVMLVFGTKRLTNLGSDLGSAIKGFRSSMREAEEEENKPESKPTEQITRQDSSVIDSEVKTGQRDKSS